MTGRYHFRRGDYNYKPVALEYGRKILTHLFKRNNYRTMVVGKPQPVENTVKDAGQVLRRKTIQGINNFFGQLGQDVLCRGNKILGV